MEGPIRKTKINALIESCKSILEKALAKNDELVILANKTDQPSKLLMEVAAWWDRIVKVNVEVTGKARAHMESNRASEVCDSENNRSKASSKWAKSGSSKQRSMKSLTPQRAPQKIAPSEDETRRIGKTSLSNLKTETTGSHHRRATASD